LRDGKEPGAKFGNDVTGWMICNEKLTKVNFFLDRLSQNLLQYYRRKLLQQD
jgi:hypothetical protein